MTRTRKMHVLIVDDDPLTRLMASEALREGGYTSVEAAQMQAPDLDSMAACLILERYFEQLHEHEKRST